ncbi:hypothetical protein [Streptomyces beihaiensis]|uniref:Uncharacterized protein n=1 Tax=Streptomyces beihaiensis TaxID=2984495 RepID=A0ABT3TQP4_9ACTN|nr:hypothetical protein [Streptomyces beihaiensis]MCX3059336.1 hypothetical protein [Streptomyces beihaiensis]
MAASDRTPTPTIVESGWSERHEVATAKCPAGTGLVGGGFDSRNTRNGYQQNTDSVELNAPSEDTPNTWEVQLTNGQARAYAMCAPGAPTPTIVASKWANSGGIARATCPEGTALIGGGADSKPSTNLYNNVTDAQQANAPDAKTANTWKAEMMNGASKALAMCVE